jgi:hypothetical protein
VEGSDILPTPAHHPEKGHPHVPAARRSGLATTVVSSVIWRLTADPKADHDPILKTGKGTINVPQTSKPVWK